MLTIYMYRARNADIACNADQAMSSLQKKDKNGDCGSGVKSLLPSEVCENGSQYYNLQ